MCLLTLVPMSRDSLPLTVLLRSCCTLGSRFFFLGVGGVAGAGCAARLDLLGGILVFALFFCSVTLMLRRPLMDAKRKVSIGYSFFR